MPVNFIQPSFAAGEICPNLYARVDLAKYHIAAKLLRNFFVWASGGVSNRAGTMFVGRCKDSAHPVHLIPFQFNLVQAYILEFGHLYMRVIMDGGYVLETPVYTPANTADPWSGIPITGITNSDPGIITVNYGAANFPAGTPYGPFSNGDQVFIAGAGTALNSTPGRQYLVQNATASTFTLTDLDGNAVNTTNCGGLALGVPTSLSVNNGGNAYSSAAGLAVTGGAGSGLTVNITADGMILSATIDNPGSGYSPGDVVTVVQAGASQGTLTITGLGPTVARVFTLPTPYAGTDVQLLKWAQSADTLTLCHPNYPPADLTRTQHWVWTLTPISFAPKTPAPSNVAFTSYPGHPAETDNNWNYGYIVTAVANDPPDESFPSAACSGAGYQLNSNIGACNAITWSSISNAQYYRIYKAQPTYNPVTVSGNAMYGYIGESTGASFVDTEIAPDFTQTPPQGTNPFNSGPITAVTITNGGSGYPQNVSLCVLDPTGTGAVLSATVGTNGTITGVTIVNGGENYSNPVVTVGNQGSGAAAKIISISGGAYGVNETPVIGITDGGQNYYGPVTVTVANGLGSGCTFTPIISNGVIGFISVGGAGNGIGYEAGSSLTFTQQPGSGATFNASFDPSGNYPSCATYFQQRKVFAGSLNNPQTIWMTQPADYKNMDISNPSESDDAIVATIASNQVNAIKWLVPMNNLVILSSGGAWLLVGGMVTSPVAVTPTNTVVVPQNYVGCADLPPIVINYDILYVQAKGSIIRDLAYNFWVNVYTGTDMSVLAQHLFFGHNMERWAYAEQPFYQVWIVRDDGVLLSLTYLKEQDVYAWAHHDSPGPSGTDVFLSVASISEQQTPGLNMDSVYFVTQRTIPGINGGNPVKYVERMDGRNFLSSGVPASAGMTADVTKAWFLDCALQYYTGTPATVISGLDHLNGATVSILADGNVSPSQTVVAGSITLPYAATRVTVGLPYVSQLQTLSMQPEGMQMQVQDYRKKISAVAVRVADTRGLKVGPNFSSLTEIKERSAQVSMGAAIPLFTGDERVVIDSQYLVDDNVCIQQDNPLPCTILGVIPEVSIGDSPG